MSVVKKNKAGRVWFHILLWMLSVLTFAYIFKLSDSTCSLDLIYSMFFHLSVVSSVYLNFYGIQKWFVRGKYFEYAVSTTAIIAYAAFLSHYTFDVLVDLVLPDYYFVSQFNYVEAGVVVTGYLIVTTTIKLSESWFDLQKVKQHIAESEKERLDGELHNLKAQINPHFLFNSLNVIYALALKSDNDTAAVVLKLSDILRYVIYDSTLKEVSLESEVRLLKKYIELQKLRVESSVPVRFISKIEKDVKVAPLVFLPLVENSFKHGIKGDTENVFIHIKLHSDTEGIYFEVENNKSEAKPNNPNTKGLGLENIKRRLEIQYPDRHEFKIYDEKDIFKVSLAIEHEKG